MKVKIFPDKGQTPEDAEETLEKALAHKRDVKEDRYARESYLNDHLDQFHDHIVNEHEKLVTRIVDDVQDLVKRTLGK